MNISLSGRNDFAQHIWEGPGLRIQPDKGFRPDSPVYVRVGPWARFLSPRFSLDREGTSHMKVSWPISPPPEV